jgi:hypothetical protein
MTLPLYTGRLPVTSLAYKLVGIMRKIILHGHVVRVDANEFVVDLSSSSRLKLNLYLPNTEASNVRRFKHASTARHIYRCPWEDFGDLAGWQVSFLVGIKKFNIAGETGVSCIVYKSWD